MLLFIFAIIYINIPDPSLEKDKNINDPISDTESEIQAKEIDISIQNIIIYPNQYDKNSIYIDVEIFSINEGYGEVQIALLNNEKLIASNPIKIFSDEKNYFQSFLIAEDVNYDRNFEIGISALQGEKNIANNRHIFQSSLKIEKPKIAILSGKLNFNTPYIVNNLNADYDHFYPNPINGELDITNFWFTKYDISNSPFIGLG